MVYINNFLKKYTQKLFILPEIQPVFDKKKTIPYIRIGRQVRKNNLKLYIFK